MKIFICGLGRIGLHVLRFLDKNYNCDIEFYDKNENIDNLAYLLNFDTVYGLRSKKYIPDLNRKLIINSETSKKIFFVNPNNSTAKIAIDCSGSPQALNNLISNKFKKIYVTNSSDNINIEEFIIANISKHSKKRVVSVSICDTTAIAPILNYIDRKYLIEAGHITTLHPWLNYQNLSDGPVVSTQIPENYWSDFALGRKSTEALISKSTTAVTALGKVFPKLAKKIGSWSIRVPTPIVSVALLNLTLFYQINNTQEVLENLVKLEGVFLGEENRISADYIGLEASCAVDPKSIYVSQKNIYLSIYYDNELGYVSQILKYIMNT
jgi:glyceraldehyde 3-phosphate dehydrogenase